MINNEPKCSNENRSTPPQLELHCLGKNSDNSHFAFCSNIPLTLLPIQIPLQLPYTLGGEPNQ